MSRPTVYLCGTITQDPKHLEWRKRAKIELTKADIGTISPVRGKSPTDWQKDGLDSIYPTIYDNGCFVPRDERDVRRCDAMLVYFIDKGDRQSIGTWIEVGWAQDLNIPFVVVSELQEVVQHPFIWKKAARICPTLDDALEYIKFLLQPGKGERD